MKTQDLTISVSENQLLTLKALANKVNSLPLTTLVSKTGHSLFELDLDTMRVSYICSKSDIQSGLYYPTRAIDKLYCFKLNKTSAIRKFEGIIKLIKQEVK